MLHIIHIVRDLDVASGWLSHAVPALAESQSSIAGVKVTVLYQDRGNPVVPLTKIVVDYRSVDINDVLFGSPFFTEIRQRSRAGQRYVFHLHGLWSPTVHRAAVFAKKHNIPYVVSSYGMLSALSQGNNSFRKKFAWWLYQKRDLEKSAFVLVSSVSEKVDVSSLIAGQNIAVVPDGCDERTENRSIAMAKPGNGSVRQAFSVGSLRKGGGFAELIGAWAMVRPKGWVLAIAGPNDKGYLEKLKSLIIKIKCSNSIVLLGEVDDEEKWGIMDNCDLFLVPSKSENFSVAIAEALQSGLPVITTTASPWSVIVKQRCGWWVEPVIEKLKKALAEATSLDEESLIKMGENGHKLITDNYTWPRIAETTVELYQSISLDKH
jgi:glycosyltransferase involved in cell wall biosynthesis